VNLIQIKELPKNIDTYCPIPPRIASEQEIEKWLRYMLTQGCFNLHIPNCDVETMAKVYDLAISHKYKIFVKAIEGKTAWAEFFLSAFPMFNSN